MKFRAKITRDRKATLCGLLRRQGAAARDVEITLPATAQACITVTPRRTAKSTRHNILTTLADPAFRMVRSDHETDPGTKTWIGTLPVLSMDHTGPAG